MDWSDGEKKENEGGKTNLVMLRVEEVGRERKSGRRGLLSACKLLAPWQPRDCGICKLSEYCDPVLRLLINDSKDVL